MEATHRTNALLNHTITYTQAESRWDEALPLGNGHFGAMGYYESGCLAFDLNHYDIYYRKMEGNRRQAAPAQAQPLTLAERLARTTADTRAFEQIKQRARAAHADPTHPAHNNYNFVVTPNRSEAYGWDRDGATLVPTARLSFRFRESAVAGNRSFLQLDIENAVVQFSIDQINGGIKTLILPEHDVLVSTIAAQSQLDSIGLFIPTFRGYQPDCLVFTGTDQSLCAFVTIDKKDRPETTADPFHYLILVQLDDNTDNQAFVQSDQTAASLDVGPGSCTLYTVVVTDETLGLNAGSGAQRDLGSDMTQIKDALLDSARCLLSKVRQQPDVLGKHQTYWRRFFAQSRIKLDDRMMETLWYVNLYALACSSGIGARIKRHACGLNGLWDIRPPTQWGSQWYWDVNIQMAFWPIYQVNHLALGDAFYAGLLSYVDDARIRAKAYYNMQGIAADYPFAHYLCIWPWCAQYFWNHYRYSGDIAFLRDHAYPLFQGLVLFFEDYLSDDPISGRKVIFPDVSPEQGPMTQNATITLACVRYLYQMTIKSAALLGVDAESIQIWQRTLDRLPDYPSASKAPYGSFILDSEWAGPDQYMAHGSPLMPIYPIGEINARSDPQMVERSRNTVNYIRDNINICTHTFGWEAAALARLGYGNEALDRLYEGGVAFQMRSNGLFAEETDRWLQNCLVAVAPVYNPPLLEGGSALVAAINEMLLSCPDDVIHVFPAVPDGTTSRVRSNEKFDLSVFHGIRPATRWGNCAFEKLLCPGGFLVSAAQKAGQTVRVVVTSQLGGLLKLVDPFQENDYIYRVNASVSTIQQDYGLFIVQTEAGVVYEWTRAKPVAEGKPVILDSADGRTYRVPDTQRTVFLGKNRDTDLIRTLEDFTLDFFAGDQRSSKITVYKIDFSQSREACPKDYTRILPRQFHGCGKQGLDFKRATVDMLFRPDLMFGFDSIDGLHYYNLALSQSADSAAFCPIRGDFIQGEGHYQWQMHLVRGNYQMLVVCGDLANQTGTELSINGSCCWVSQQTLASAGYEGVVLPFAHRQDGIFTLDIRSVGGKPFSLCAMLVNRIR